MTNDEINSKYLALHDALGRRKDWEDKEEFDRQHGQIWRDCDVQLNARKEELKAKTKLTHEEQAELGELRMFFPDPSSEPSLKQRIAELETRLTALEAKTTE